MEIEQGTYQAFDGNRYPSSEHTLWVNDDELDTIAEALGYMAEAFDSEKAADLYQLIIVSRAK